MLVDGFMTLSYPMAPLGASEQHTSIGKPHRGFLVLGFAWGRDESPGQQLESQPHRLRGSMPVSAIVESLMLLLQQRCSATGDHVDHPRSKAAVVGVGLSMRLAFSPAYGVPDVS
jgi:hypothetical protein